MNRNVVLMGLSLFLLVACLPATTTEPVQIPVVRPTHTPLSTEAAPATLTLVVPTATPMQVETAVSLTDPGWVHIVEFYEDREMVVTDPITGQTQNAILDLIFDQWYLLDEAGDIIAYVSLIEDTTNHILQVSKLRDGFCYNLTFGTTSECFDQYPLTDYYQVDKSTAKSVSIERVETLPADILAYFDQVVVPVSCPNGTTDPDEVQAIRQELESLVSNWLEPYTTGAGWLHVNKRYAQDEVALPYDNYPYPLVYTTEEWYLLDAEGQVVDAVWVGIDETGAVYDQVVTKDMGSAPPLVDVWSFGQPINVTMNGLIQEERELNGRSAILFVYCQNYQGPGPMIGDIPFAIAGDQLRLWFDATTGQLLLYESVYIDFKGSEHPNYSQLILSIERQEQPPPDILKLLEQASEG